MTEFLWDQSHYDGVITKDTMIQAKAEGIVGVHHKVGEGIGGDDPQDSTALAAARHASIEFIGGYHVTRTGDPGAQVDALLALADRDEGWWRDFPGWFWVEDLERWEIDAVPATTGIAVARLLRERTQRTVFLYASHGQYGDQLRDWDGPLWNADYVSRPAAGFKTMYPGDNWTPWHNGWYGGWGPYSGKTPTFLQYTSSATIAGLSTCDANAFRGSLADLRSLIQGGTMTAPGHVAHDEYIDEAVNHRVFSTVRMRERTTMAGYTGSDGEAKPGIDEPNDLVVALNEMSAAIAALLVKVGALAASGAVGLTGDQVRAIVREELDRPTRPY